MPSQSLRWSQLGHHSSNLKKLIRSLSESHRQGEKRILYKSLMIQHQQVLLIQEIRQRAQVIRTIRDNPLSNHHCRYSKCKCHLNSTTKSNQCHNTNQFNRYHWTQLGI